MTGPSAWSERPDGVTLSVRLTPKADRDALEGCETRDDGRAVLRARVRAVPENGKAHAALTRLIADRLSLPASAVALAAGATGRVKTLAIRGEPAALAAALSALAAGDADETRHKSKTSKSKRGKT